MITTTTDQSGEDGESPQALGYRMPAEWQARQGTLMSWPVRASAWLEGLDEAERGYAEVARAIAEFENLTMVARPIRDESGSSALERAKKMLPPTVELWDLNHDDSWIRDNGPTFILNAQGERGGINWRFNAWGEKYHPYDADDRLASLILQKMKVRRFDAPLVLEGGSIHVDGEGTLLTTEECLLAKNRNPHLSKERIEAYLRSYLGVSKILWLDRGLFGDETDGHVDNVACFVRPSVVVMQVAQDAASPNYGNTQKNLDRLRHERDARNRPLEVVPIPEPPERFCRGERLTLSYINFYPVTGALIVPVFGLDGSADLRRSDDRALGILRELYSDRKIVPIDGMKIIKGGGNVHCITQQIPAPVPPGGMA